MTYSIARQADGAWSILDGVTVIVPDIPDNATAWRKLDRMQGDDASMSEARASWGFKRAAVTAPYSVPSHGQDQPKAFRSNTRAHAKRHRRRPKSSRRLCDLKSPPVRLGRVDKLSTL